MNERRYEILWLDRTDLINLIHGAVRITNLPADVRVEAMCADMNKDAIGLRLRSKEFPDAGPGGELRNFVAEFQEVRQSDIAAEQRYAEDAAFRAMSGCTIEWNLADAKPLDVELMPHAVTKEFKELLEMVEEISIDADSPLIVDTDTEW